MRGPLAFTLTLLAALPAGAAEPAVRITARDGLFDLVAVSAPIADVLDRLQERAAFRVAYVGSRPATRVSLDARGRSQADALMLVLGRLGPGYGYALGLTADRARVATVVITETKSTWVEARDPFEPPPGKGEALEAVRPAWELEAERELARLAPTPLPARRPSAPESDPSEPTFGHGADPFTPPEGRGDQLEPVAPRTR